ncbi:MAG: hypothetical protein RIS64_1842 [Bacteroidota bacterium]
MAKVVNPNPNQNPNPNKGNNPPQQNAPTNRPPQNQPPRPPQQNAPTNRPPQNQPPAANPKPPVAPPPSSRPPQGQGTNPHQKGGIQPKKPQELEHRINDAIRVPEIRLVGDSLEELSAKLGEKIIPGVYPTKLAREWADKMEIDLVEITPNATPPVCRLIDYAKFLYQKKKREKEIKSNAVKTVVKEIRFGPETGEHDLEFKIRHATEFLKEGSKVKAYVQFKGRAIVFKERGELILLKFMKALEDFGQPESLPKLEGKKMMVTVTPKKGGAKK